MPYLLFIVSWLLIKRKWDSRFDSYTYLRSYDLARTYYICFHVVTIYRLLWMPLTWSDARWTSSGSRSLISRSTSSASLRRQLWSRHWMKLVMNHSFNHILQNLDILLMHTVKLNCICLQMSRTSGRTAHGARSWLSRRRGHRSMTLTGSRSCWRRSRWDSQIYTLES